MHACVRAWVGGRACVRGRLQAECVAAHTPWRSRPDSWTRLFVRDANPCSEVAGRSGPLTGAPLGRAMSDPGPSGTPRARHPATPRRPRCESWLVVAKSDGAPAPLPVCRDRRRRRMRGCLRRRSGQRGPSLASSSSRGCPAQRPPIRRQPAKCRLAATGPGPMRAAARPNKYLCARAGAACVSMRAHGSA